jgi:Peptidase family M28
MVNADQPSQTQYPAQAISLIFGILVLVIIGQSQTMPPAPTPVSSPLTSFSSARAMSHVRQIASKPHPTGTPENAKVRQYLVNQLKALGFKPEIQSTFVVNPNKKHAGKIDNVLVRIPGKSPGKALLLSAHYDSVPVGPGAADDGASVAAILETLRAIKTHPLLQNDLICLFTDSEETGLLGAHAFVEQHPWAKDVGLALNFEYRGNSGAFMMFETSQGNGKLIKGLADAAPVISATSLFYEVYNHLPNDTDLSVFKLRSIPGMNFAAIEGYTSYHTQLDHPELLNQGSLQQEGDIMLALVKHFGNISLTDLNSNDNVYFDFPVLGLVNYPVSWIFPLNGLLLMLFATALTFALKTKAVRANRIVAGTISFPFILFGLAVTSHFLWQVICRLHPEYESFIQGDTYNSHWYLLAFVFLNIGMFAYLHTYITKWLRPIEFVFGIMACWLTLLALTSIWLPGVSFLLFWPLAAMLMGLGMTLILRKNSQQPVHALLVFLGSIPGILIFVPFLKNLFVALTPHMVGVVVIFLDLLLGLLTPLLERIEHRKYLIRSSLLLGFAALAAGSFTSGFDTKHPRQNTLSYTLGGTPQHALWLSSDQQLDEWTSTYFPNINARRRLPELFGDNSPPLWAASAPLLTIASPKIETLEDSVIAGKHTTLRALKIGVKSTRHAPKLKITIEGIDVLESIVAGQLYSKYPQSQWSLNSVGLIDESLIIKFIVKAGIPFKVRAIDFSHDIPVTAQKPRPISMISKPTEFSDTTAVVSVFDY